MLKSVRKPDGSLVSFEYDALGRRISKTVGENIKRFLWDANVILHEWDLDKKNKPRTVLNELGEVYLEKQEPISNLVTWVYEERTFVPSAKIVANETFSIISDYIGRPVQCYNESGSLVWQTDYDIYGRLRNLQGEKSLIPFRQLGQYEDEEIDGLYLNRFRFYDSNSGVYISQDPIGLEGGMPQYNYSSNSNLWVDIFGLSSNSALLGQNLGPSPGLNHDAHHIIMTGTQNPKMNSLVAQMKAHGIDPDGKQNGIWLARTDADKISGISANTSHKQDGLHGNAYKDELFERLDGKNKKEFKAELKKIKEELKSGRTWETFTTKKLGKVCR